MEPSQADIRRHIFGTYLNVRFGMGVAALLYPGILYLWGRANGVDLAPSISEYYWHTEALGSPVRVWMVGGLFAIGLSLYLYQGFTKGENYALNAAGVCALCVALIPVDIHCGDSCSKVTWHGFFAVSLFALLVYVTWLRSKDTLKYLPTEAQRKRFLRLYRTTSVVMGLSPAVAVVLQSLLGQAGKHIFFIEAAGVWAFAAFWLVKSLEMKISGVERASAA